MLIFHAEYSLKEGFEILNVPRLQRNINGSRVSAPSGFALWKFCNEKNIAMKCWVCGVEADRFILKHQRNDTDKPPVLELYAHNGHSLVMMTRDHIIPVSLGGSDSVENLRPGCSPCNNSRKNTMDQKDLDFMQKNPHLWTKNKSTLCEN